MLWYFNFTKGKNVKCPVADIFMGCHNIKIKMCKMYLRHNALDPFLESGFREGW